MKIYISYRDRPDKNRKGLVLRRVFRGVTNWRNETALHFCQPRQFAQGLELFHSLGVDGPLPAFPVHALIIVSSPTPTDNSRLLTEQC